MDKINFVVDSKYLTASMSLNGNLLPLRIAINHSEVIMMTGTHTHTKKMLNHQTQLGVILE